MLRSAKNDSPNQLIKSYRRKLIASSESANSYFLYGRLLGSLGYINKTPYIFQLALQKDPHSLWGHYGLGMYYLRKKSIFQARPYFEKCLRLNKTFVPALVALAKIYLMTKPQQAFDYLSKAAKITPKNSELYHHLANVSVIMNNEKQAILYFQQALSLAPQNIEIMQDFAGLMVKLKKYSQATTVLHKVYRLHSSSVAKKQIAKTIRILEAMANDRDE